MMVTVNARSSETLRQFEKAYTVRQQPPFKKLWRPGAHKFLRRLAARHGILAGPVASQLFFGEKMQVVLPEVISEAIYTYGFFDETVTWMVLQSVHPGDCVLDVGAHYGYFSLLFSHLAGRAGRVLCLEPTPSTFAVLSGNALGRFNIEVLNCAAGDRPGRTMITDYGIRYSAWNTLTDEPRLSGMEGQRAHRVETEVVRLDDMCASKQLCPDFIKIDAENFEEHVVIGLHGVIEKYFPTLLLETGSARSLAAIRVLMDKGYGIHVSEGPGTLNEWAGGPEEANARYKDMLFVHPEGGRHRHLAHR